MRDFSLDPAHDRPLLLDRHLLILVTVGHGSQEVDFRSYPCRPGSLLWVQPGQVMYHGGQAGLDAIMVSWSPEAMLGLGVTPVVPPFGAGYWQLAGEDEDAVINEVSQLVVDCQRHRGVTLATDLLRHQLAVLLLRLALLPASPASSTPPHPPLPGPVRPPGVGLTVPPRPAGIPPRPAGTLSTGPMPSGAPSARPIPIGTAANGSVPVGTVPRAPGSPDGPDGPDGLDGPGVRDATSTFWRLRHEVERSYGQTRRVEDYADRLACSVRTLTRACLSATGRSAKQVIDDRVALEARRLLAATDLPVADVGRRLGFSEPTNFGRFFHREVGHSPGAFRAGLVGRAPGGRL